MIVNLLLALSLLSALGSGLIAGVFFAFSAFVMAALARLPPKGGIAAMQSINVVVLNRPFLGVLFGTGLVSLILAATSLLAGPTSGAWYALAGCILYLLGTLGVTIAFNVPLNDRLARTAPDSAEGASLWQHYLARWTAWNTVRTVAAAGAMALFILALRQLG
jgi:uncharacterized membrane protein